MYLPHHIRRISKRWNSALVPGINSALKPKVSSRVNILLTSTTWETDYNWPLRIRIFRIYSFFIPVPLFQVPFDLFCENLPKKVMHDVLKVTYRTRCL